jgi:ATP-dependent Clp protease ATP-binding subunit ClpX
MFELPALEGVQEVVISEEVVSGNARPLYIYAEPKKEKGSVSA